MKTSPVTRADLSRSVVAVPPLARHADLSLNHQANAALLEHLEAGGVRSVLYGGNANLYHQSLGEYPALLDWMAEAAGPDTWMLPSVGPDFGKAIDQAEILRSRPFPTAMLLPMSFPFTSDGLAVGVRRFTDAYGKPAVVYIKSENYLAPDALAALVEEGRVAAIKYAVVRSAPETDAYLAAILEAVDPALVVSGIGERPAIVHLRRFGLAGFTSGCVCLAPRGSMALLHALQAGRYAEAERIWARYMPMEDCRDAISPIRVLHEAVTLAGVADMGPMLPMLSNIGAAESARVAPAARALYEQDGAFAEAAATAI
jgi:dihydrodipicolinate synthase/N-acetylneuraminate lyase